MALAVPADPARTGLCFPSKQLGARGQAGTEKEAPSPLPLAAWAAN